MHRSRVVLTTATVLCGALAFLLGTVGSSTPADAVDTPRPTVRPERRPTVRRVVAPTPRPPAPVLEPVELEHVITLTTDLRDALPASATFIPVWDAERLWPLPDDLPDDQVVFALQEVFSARGDERDAALDTLDLALLDADLPADPWVQLAHLEAERTLARAAYEDDLLQHEARLVAWAEAGGHDAMPDAPEPWSSADIGDDAEHLALAIDAFGEDPDAADLARLTAAAGWLDWTSDEIDEDSAIEALFAVIDRTDDPVLLAGAVDLLVGTDTTLPDGGLADLEALLPRLPDDVAMRLSWFVADRWLQDGEAEAALRVLDHGIAAGVEAEGPQVDGTLDVLQQVRGAVYGHVFGPGGDSVTDALDTLAWHCWSELLESDEPWVADGTDYSGTVVLLPGGVHWTDWTDDNAHGACMMDGAAAIPLPSVPTRVHMHIGLRM